jgi:hypothetical protein
MAMVAAPIASAVTQVRWSNVVLVFIFDFAFDSTCFWLYFLENSHLDAEDINACGPTLVARG